MLPKFAVDEVVVLKSIMDPASNGEYTVLSVEYGVYKVPTMDKPYTGYKYVLSDGYIYGWIEPALRKKHIPGELSFTDLMASLSSPKLITHQT